MLLRIFLGTLLGIFELSPVQISSYPSPAYPHANINISASGKTQKPFMRCFPNCHHSKQWVAKGSISIYIVKANLSKNLNLKGRSEFILNMVPMLEAQNIHSYACLKHFLRVIFPLTFIIIYQALYYWYSVLYVLYRAI
jgi:hypothetical protein